jgi:hypothetical protein
MGKMKRIVIFTLILGCFPAPAWATEDWSTKPIIDEEFKRYELEMKSVTKECMKKEKNIMKKMNCGDAFSDELRKQGKLRGTEEYCRKHYGHLKYDQLLKLWEKKREQRSKARDPLDRLPGELSSEMFRAEESWLWFKLTEIRQSRRLVE